MLCLSEHPPVLLLLLLLLVLSSEMLLPSGRFVGVSLRGKLLLLQGKSSLCVFMGKCTDTADDVAAAAAATASLLNLLVGDNNDELEQPANILYKNIYPPPN